ncbi:uncharacterized protein BCR38DRAFT_490545 [Pseudomassariella vexata]|uniref:Six-hairpin glycosidase-like protein n=1 Tax=Pseudomassariella vexata TaxID=1141098 RepID=A0A1Y2DBM2_9PEZI|nr:uncharacterized protein BCR38DRAFT_490545 [Pseudomassariella vexata]ORY56659.1 hypothetical protein BCR38DRAFT_490545 [Pseudomassariella vexata]
MHPRAVSLLAILGASLVLGAPRSFLNTSTLDVAVRWLEGAPDYNSGTTFGLPWPRGKFNANTTTFTGTAGSEKIQLQSWVTGYWPDGSVKWSGHAIPASQTIAEEYTITASGSDNLTVLFEKRQSAGIATDSGDGIVVDTGKISVTFPKSGSVLVSSIQTSGGKTVGQSGRLILRTQSDIIDYEDNSVNQTSIEHLEFQGVINQTTISEDSSTRALVTVSGTHQTEAGAGAWLPFTVRFYLYASSDAIKIVHNIVYDKNSSDTFVTGIGIKFDVPLAEEELYNRHVRLAGVDGGFFNEAVQGITGLRRDPGQEVSTAQVEGEETPDISTWATTVSSRTQWIPAWNDFRLTQLSPDGFNLQKRTKVGQSWVKIPGGTRSDGLAYLGGATAGGLAVGLRDFWKKYPTSLDISNAATDTGSITVWLYSPSAGPLDLRPFHDGLGESGNYTKQLDALEITYEDYEEGYNTPYGISKYSELFLYAFDTTPSSDTLATLTAHTNQPPVLFAEPDYIHSTKAIGSYWAPPDNSTAAAATIESNLNFLLSYYQQQVEQRRWYGFWDFGDFMHTYDVDRHTWRYDIGGYAWDNSELSPDLFWWNYFLRSGRADVYRFAEAQLRHVAETDVYHLGHMKGLGTRHGVQHWGDSAKQVRISTPIYRKIFWHLSGGDERVGELVREVLDVGEVWNVIDARRKVHTAGVNYVPDPTAVWISLGIDWSGIAIAWLIEWERRGPRWEESRERIFESMRTIANLTNGFVTGEALYNTYTGAISPPPTDPENLGEVTVAHLSASFGMLETISQLLDHLGPDDVPTGFLEAWLDYCYYYGASSVEQTARYGVSFGNLNLKQGHSRLTAWAANHLGNETLAQRAWNEFYNTDGLSLKTVWETEKVSGSKVLIPVDEASWLAANDAALYGLAGLENLALVGSALGDN